MICNWCKKFFVLLIIISLVVVYTSFVEARRGCCSWHGGVARCDHNVGRLICKDGTYSPSCGCPKTKKSVIPSPPTREIPKNETKIPNKTENKSELHLCIRVVDGDTIILEGNERVRLIGVDTPETKHLKKPVQYFGKEASAFTKRMVEGKKVRLEYDWQKRDKYGRLLAYVYLKDGTFLNAEIIKQGYGFAYTRFPFKYLDDFRQYEREARENNKGLWENR